jgi:predicted metal-dependent hydrolase
VSTVEPQRPADVPDFDVDVVRSKRAKRVSVRVDRSSGQVRVTLPQRAPLAEVDRALLRHRRWIAARLSEAAAVRAQVQARGNVIEVWGDPLEIVAEPGRQRVHAKDGRILVPPGNPEALQRWLRTQARERLTQRTHDAAAALGKPVSRISIGDAKTRWGSCTAKGTITYSWRLVIAPPWVAEAIIWHEVCHLVELNHSARFWTLLRRHEPRTDDARAWLREHGATLLLPTV